MYGAPGLHPDMLAVHRIVACVLEYMGRYLQTDVH